MFRPEKNLAVGILWEDRTFSSIRDRVRTFGKKRQASHAIRRAAIDALNSSLSHFCVRRGFGRPRVELLDQRVLLSATAATVIGPSEIDLAFTFDDPTPTSIQISRDGTAFYTGPVVDGWRDTGLSPATMYRLGNRTIRRVA